MDNNKVNKAMGEEEKTVLSNIQSLIQQLLSANQGESEIAMNMDEKNKIQMADDNGEKKPDEKKEDEEKDKTEKAIETTPSEGPTASDKKENRIDDNLSESTEDNVDEVSKTLIKALSHVFKEGQVKKSQVIIDPKVKALQDLTNVVKGLSENQNVISDSLTQLFQGIGLADQLKISKSVSEQNGLKKGAPITSTDNGKMFDLINEIQKSLNTNKEKEEDHNLSNAQRVHKNLANADVLKQLTGVRTLRR